MLYIFDLSRRILSLLSSAMKSLYYYVMRFITCLASVLQPRTQPLRVIRLEGAEDPGHILHTQMRYNSEERYVIELPWRTIHILPRHFLSDYGWKKDEEISSNIDLRERILGKWTLLGSLTPMEPGDRTHSAVAFIKDCMTKNMGLYFNAVHEEIGLSLERHVGNCPNWQGYAAYQLCIDMNLQIFERVFVGLDLCRNDDWNAACQGYSTSAIQTAAALMRYSWWQQPFVAPFLTECKTLNKHIMSLQQHLGPVLKARLCHIKAVYTHKPGQARIAMDFIDWWIENAPEQKRSDSYALTVAMIQLNIAGIQSTAMITMQALFDLASRPEYTEALLIELTETFQKYRSTELPPQALSSLVKMDSFLKESQRHVAQNLLSIYRKVMSPLSLKDGSTLPSGSYVAVPSENIETDEYIRKFEGFRWQKLRERSQKPQRFTTVASRIDSLEYGYGVHACPGRFFATNTVKASLAAILSRYELRMPLGERLPDHKYNSILVLIPPKAQKIELRARSKMEAGGIRS